jgi:hypothetical protein
MPLNISLATILLMTTLVVLGNASAGTGSDAVWTPVYGNIEIASERPYQAVLMHDRWTVTGSVPKVGAGAWLMP